MIDELLEQMKKEKEAIELYGSFNRDELDYYIQLNRTILEV